MFLACAQPTFLNSLMHCKFNVMSDIVLVGYVCLQDVSKSLKQLDTSIYFGDRLFKISLVAKVVDNVKDKGKSSMKYIGKS